MKEALYKLLYEGSATISPLFVVQNMGVAFVLALILCTTYKLTYSGVSYSKKFNTSLLMMSLITTMVMSILGSSLALSLGMVGALSIVRFRTAVKDPRDTTYIFWAISIGLGAGSSNYFIIIIGTIFIAIITVIVELSFKGKDVYLVIVRSDLASLEAVRSSLFKIYKAGKLRAETITDDYAEVVYQVMLKDNHSVADYEKIKEINGVYFVNMVSRDGETLG
ncbi:hypothetical protein BW727_100002 [Jeotgalibaca dankookensis]|uniref:DUF4956 domain-containing protein n=1 Tax=Jeotgalibaca dankookensis TaxID=708126 RepID=A0A1S6ILH4_9LACT|nr:DUF4956 domain-containing protein [Jeotgalibaca dankookensis]AQS52412.1 hypothetical protein BW727_100002 [Jeotgalibaca dankookensis]